MKKRILALCMAVAVTFTTVATDVTVYAGQSETTTETESEVTDESGQTAAEGVDSTEAETEEADSTEAETEEADSTEVETENVDSTEAVAAEEVDSTEAETTEDDAEVTEEKLNYLTVGSPYVEVPGTQKILADFGDENTVVKSASMVVQNTDTLETKTVETSEISYTSLLFELAYQDESDAGAYKVVSLHVETEAGSYDLDLEEIGINAQYGVNQSVDTQPDASVVDEDEDDEEDISCEVVSIGADGSYTTETTLEDALDSVQDASDLENVKGNLVVCLDPGHGGTDGGASANGLVEKNLNLKIAQYAKAELETYAGVTVYMTRTGDNYLTLDERVAYATSVGANVFVSIHINSGSSVASGAEVYYPNSNYNATVGTIGHDLAEKILAKLVSLGLANRGTKIRNSESGDTYDDGSLCDYYGVIRRAKKAGIPGLIVEHAFVSNASDASNFLNSDEKLQALGVADATGIAEYYGLVKKSSTPTISYTQSKKGGKLKVKWTAVDGATSYQVYRSTEKNGEYAELATVTGTTSYTDTSVKVGKKYYYKVCAVFSNGTVGSLSAAVSGVALDKATITSVVSKSKNKIQITWKKVSGASGYYVYRKNESTGSFEQVATVTGGSVLSYVDGVSKNNTKYTYKVKAYNVSGSTIGEGKNSDPKSGKAIAKPVISSITSLSQSALTVKWKKVGGADGYIVKRSTSQNGTYTTVKTITNADTLSYKDTKVEAGVTYYYKIKAYDDTYGTKGYSGNSSPLGGKTIAKTKIKTVTSVSATTLKITWNKTSGAYGYLVKRSTSKNGTYTTIATLKSESKTSYQDKNVSTGKKYYYKVETMVDNNGTIGYGGNSSPMYGKTIEKTSISSVVAQNSTSVIVTWKKNADAYGYRVKRSTSKDGTYTVLAELTGASTIKYTDKTAKEGTTYYYKVEVMNQVNGTIGYSGNSKPVSVKTIQKVKVTSIKGVSSTSLYLQWQEVSDITGYQIYRSTSQNGTYKKIATVKGKSNVSYTDTGLSAGATYYYKIRGYRTSGSVTEYGTSSAKQKAWTLKKVTISEITTSGSTTVNLSWNKVDNANGYAIYRKKSTDTSFQKLKTITSADTLSYSDTSVEAGTIYYYKICATAKVVGTSSGRGDYSTAWKVPLLATGTISSVSLGSAGTLTISWEKVGNASGYQLSYSTSKNGTYTSLTKTSSTSYTHTGLTSGSTYYYKVRAYVKLADGSKVYGAWSSVESQTVGYLIMGSSDLTVSEMVSYYNARYTYPSDVYTSKGASTAKKFFTILKQEAEAEGVKTEVLFAQVILETGGLQFGGDVKAEQCNFGGLGAVGGGASGETYANVRTGLRAQVQHLKAYASTEDLNNTCVDTRFKYVTRGTAPYVEWLSIPNNPYGKGWASDASYGTKLLNIINSL